MSSHNSCSLLILIFLLHLLHVGSADLTISSKCLSQCGGIDIPYPFGIGKGCYLEKWYEIECLNSSISGMLEPFLSMIQKQVVNIDVSGHLPIPNRLDPQTYGSVFIKNPIISKGCSNDEEKPGSLLNLTGTPFFVGYGNTLLAFGCNNTASLTNIEPNMVGCTSSCGAANLTASKDYFASINCDYESMMAARTTQICNSVNETSCNGVGCCKASMPDGIQQVVGVKIEDNNSTAARCKVAFLTAESYYMLNGDSPQQIHALQYSTVKLGWSIYTRNLSFIDSLGCQNVREYEKRLSFDPKVSCICDYNADSSYASCGCTKGYSGSPYTGCKDIDECLQFKYFGNINNMGYCEKGRTCVNRQGEFDCVYPKTRLIGIGLGASFGLLVFSGGVYWLYRFIRKQRRLIRQRKFFKRNGGLLLQQQLTSTQGNIEKTRLFSSTELEKATENFSLNRILGQGGQGTVYKGMLVDGRIVAVKKSKVVDEDKLEEFINEVVILSQINHRNIVKLLGCCLETDVPVLVYEFIPNGNLLEHLHDEWDDNMMVTWEVRLRIAVDIAGALSYLHSAASSPIYHRDVKSTNIMLDEKFRAKVSDFGTSRSVTVDHTHLTTVVSGTMGYMDPEYFQSSQFTDKSDVYSFGVVLAELITGEKSISFLRSQENRTLATYFIVALKENKLFDIIDARIKSGCKLDQVTAAAKIARRCLNMKGKKRPNMREVSMELERIRSSLGDKQQHEFASEDEEENEEGIMEVNIGVESWDNVAVTAPASQYNNDASSISCSDAEPLFPLHTR